MLMCVCDRGRTGGNCFAHILWCCFICVSIGIDVFIANFVRFVCVLKIFFIFLQKAIVTEYRESTNDALNRFISKFACVEDLVLLISDRKTCMN